ncbi:acetyl-CoA hydrolase/transferase C-terminal domain-containing protein [Paracoccus onubensis]|uniref:acetyl-CoA hydrolase/transferase C-terminal domain-containing protein n=1 Tax=Paracoccus onubensis TaxID=1675788 RepID=UPI00273008E7|nr:acetyl-CoA hydrolase/transferase C-terminal domain-containing protein [Paracoccus onubensis]MDP0926851.1 acetyl-CoA hydrolase/transferase C-terminal domain-containing protein [Paracoccus onubensis]
MTRYHDDDAIAREIVRRTGGTIRLALPLGLGKPVRVANALVQLACDDPRIDLLIFTALTLERPRPGSGIERRFLEPAMDRLFGAYPGLLYADLLRRGELPGNITVNEFFFMAGRWGDVAQAQQDFISVNYTHALGLLARMRPNVVAQLVAEEDGRFSLSGNTDISADLFRMRRDSMLDFLAVAETHADLPFFAGRDAVLDPGEFALVLDRPDDYELFSAPKRPVDDASHAIGLHVSRLIEDGGTLQIGIGSVGDAVANALLLRHRDKVKALQADCPFTLPQGGDEPFKAGLYAVTEMLVGGLLELFEAGVIDREVDGCAIHAGFFVETRDFYRRLRQMDPGRLARIGMVPVSFTNQLYGDESGKRAARKKARFVNAAMQVSVLGDIMSDAVADGKVISGIGGQFNFVEQAFALDHGRAIITLPATRMTDGRLGSNISWSLPSVSVPRHMRDIVVTEYGIADLRGKTDAQVIAALIAIADSRFQPDLLRRAKSAGKLPKDFRLPATATRNSPERLTEWLDPYRASLPRFPFGTDFDEIEQQLLPALSVLKELSPTLRGKARLLAAALGRQTSPDEERAMRRMGFDGRENSMEALALRGALRLSRRSGGETI